MQITLKKEKKKVSILLKLFSYRLWDRRTASSFSTLAGGHDDSVLSVCWPADGQFLLASGSTDCNVSLI